jgi:acyl carrier protein
MNKNKNKKIIKDLGVILEKKNIKETDKISDLVQFDSLIILQIMNLAKISYKKQIDGRRVAKCKKISDIVALIN